MMVCFWIWRDRMIGPYFVDWNFIADKYLIMLQEEIFPSLIYEEGNSPVYFRQDGAPSHFGIYVRQLLDRQFPGAWNCRRSPVE